MSAQRPNAIEKDLEKFIKFLALKSTQAVVQSRLGEKIQTQCNPLAGNDWFNIVVEDHPDVCDEMKRALALKPGQSILQRLPLCVEISLKTVEGDQMILEVWSLDLLQPANGGTLPRDDPKAQAAEANIINNTNGTSDCQVLRAAHAIYNRMGIMLKSVISLTRTTPAYKLSRRQCPESYGIFYRIYVDRPQTHTLGEGHKQVKIGQINTIVGSLVMSVAYRTKLTISPTAAQGHHAEHNTIMLKSDHFRRATDANSPTQQLAALAANKKLGPGMACGATIDKRCIDIEKPLRPGAFTETGKLRQYTEEDYVLPETPPFEWLLKRGRGSLESLNENSHCNNNINNNDSCLSNNKNCDYQQPQVQQQHNNINNNSLAFKSFEKPKADAAVAAADCKTTLASISISPMKSLLIAAPAASYRHNSAPTLKPSSTPNDDDNLLKELHFPFASPTSHVNDLAKFYRDCYHAPPLRGLNELQAEISANNASVTTNTTAGTASTSGCGATAAAAASAGVANSGIVDDLSRQLEQFETSLEDYDKLFSQYGLTGSSSTTGSRSSSGLQMSN